MQMRIFLHELFDLSRDRFSYLCARKTVSFYPNYQRCRQTTRILRVSVSYSGKTHFPLFKKNAKYDFLS